MSFRSGRSGGNREKKNSSRGTQLHVAGTRGGFLTTILTHAAHRKLKMKFREGYDENSCSVGDSHLCPRRVCWGKSVQKTGEEISESIYEQKEVIHRPSLYTVGNNGGKRAEKGGRNWCQKLMTAGDRKGTVHRSKFSRTGPERDLGLEERGGCSRSRTLQVSRDTKRETFGNKKV